LTWLQRSTNRVQSVYEIAVLTNLVQCFLAHAGHDAHGQNNVCRVSQLNTELRVRVADWAHAERNDVHGASAHSTAELLRHFFLHCCWRYRVVGRSGSFLVVSTDEGAGPHALDIRR